MKSRVEIKAFAKEAMKEQQGVCMLIMLVLCLIPGVASLLALIPGLGFILSMAISVCLVVVEVGLCGAFISVYRKQKIEFATPFVSLKENFARKLGGMYWMALFVWLWSMLFVIPGIIKGISYSMTPYILADCPNVKAKDALKLSMRMTNGHKGELFVLYLSFLGWMILSSLTCGILLVVYTGPYMLTTYAGYYEELRDKALASGTIKAEELA